MLIGNYEGAPMHSPILALAAMVAFFGFQEPAIKTASVDYSKVERKIARQPKYVAAPKYALLLLGGEGKIKIWMALDKSKPDSEYYDVLYLDRNANGRLDEAGERIMGSEDRDHRVIMEVGRLEIPESKVVLENMRVYTQFSAHTSGVIFVSFRLNGRVNLYGGYGPGQTIAAPGDSPEKAPILHADPDGPLSFFLYSSVLLKAGESLDIRFMVGTPGSGAETFMAVDDDFLKLPGDKIFVTVIAKDSGGKEVRARSQIKG